MVNFIIRRILHTVPVLFGVVVITFILMYMIPGDPVVSMVGERYDEATIHKLRKELHLDDSLPMQFVRYVGNVVRGDFGKSFITGGSVSEELLRKFPNTMMLAVASMIIAIITGLTMGIISSLKPQSILDKITMLFALVGISAPVFWVGLMLVLFVGVYLQWLPPTGFGGIEHSILPAIGLGLRSAAYVARWTRATMLEVLNQDGSSESGLYSNSKDENATRMESNS